MAFEIEKFSEEIGEEAALCNNDDGTICSKIIGSTIPEKNSEEMSVVKNGSIDAPQISKVVDPEEECKDEDDDLAAFDDVEKSSNDDVMDEIEAEDRDFDKNPTVLYALVQKKLWKETIARAKKSPGEARAFICRREKDGRVRWRLLPLHAAIVFKAPEDVVETLLTAFPKASEAKDDQGMLPLHLAFRNGASESAVNLLLLAYPQSVDIPDRKGRVPLTLAKAASSPNREIYIQALEKGPSHYAVSALACARARITAEQNAIFEAKLLQARASHQCVVSEIEAEAEKEKEEALAKIEEKEKELYKLHETSQVLVDHVTSLEAQINTRSDTERFLATKIAKLEEKLRESEGLKDEREKFMVTKITKLEEDIKETERLMEERESDFKLEKDYLLAKINLAETEISANKEKLASSIETLGQKEQEWAATEKSLDSKYRETEIEWANAQANCAIIEAQLKKKSENEHVLASQVSNLASRLAECSHEMNENKVEFKKELAQFRDERTALKDLVENLTKRLNNVNAVLKSTHHEQITIVDDAIGNEESMASCMETHARMVSESIQQERMLRNSREEMMKMIEQSYDEAEEKRRKLMESITVQGRHLSSMIKTRGNMLSCVQNVTKNITGVLQNDLANENLSEKVTAKSVDVFEKKIDVSAKDVSEDSQDIQKQPEVSPSLVDASLVDGGKNSAEQLKPESAMQKYNPVVCVVDDNVGVNEDRSEFEEPRNHLCDGRIITAE